MKRFLSLVLALVLILALAGCGAGTAAPTQPETTPAVSQPDTDVGDPADIEPNFVIDRNGGFPYQTETMELDSDGGKIHTVLYIPESGAEIFPAVIFSHGFGDTGRGGQAYAQALASQGYLAVCFDFRGGGPASQSDGSSLDMTIFTEQQDLEAELAMMRQREDVDDRYIFLLGNSQGGVVAALTAAAHPEEVRAMALSSPAFSLADDARQRFSSMEEIPAQSFHILMNVGHDYFASVLPADIVRLSASFGALEGAVRAQNAGGIWGPHRNPAKRFRWGEDEQWNE